MLIFDQNLDSILHARYLSKSFLLLELLQLTAGTEE